MKPKAMTSKERLWAAINLQAYDRVPVYHGVPPPTPAYPWPISLMIVRLILRLVISYSMTWADWISSRYLASRRH